MRDLTELNSYITKIPCIFAAQNTGAVSTFSDKASSPDKTTNFETGFPHVYSKDPTASSDKGEYIPRKDINRVGELATQEMFFKKIGCIHTFSTAVSGYYGGFQKDIVLHHCDGTYDRSVKSEILSNTVDFTTQPYSIDCIPTGQQDVVWRTVSHIHGMSDNALRLTVDFSRRNDLHDGEKLEFDSLVVIGQAAYKASTNNPLTPMKGTVTVYTPEGTIHTISLGNKGRCGLNAKVFGFLFWAYPYPDPLCGVANYSIAFFAKKGTAISVSITACGEDMTKGTGVFAYPVVTKVEQ